MADTLHARWMLPTGEEIRLITLEELKGLPDGTVLVDIFGQRAVIGSDQIDMDTRGGLVAYSRNELSATSGARAA
jgi:hypothetical protein